MLTRDGADPIIVDAAVSSLKGIEADVLTKVMQAKTAARRAADRGGGDARRRPWPRAATSRPCSGHRRHRRRGAAGMAAHGAACGVSTPACRRSARARRRAAAAVAAAEAACPD